jgi:hypothetical protein
MRSVEIIRAPHSRFRIGAFDAFSDAVFRRF